MNAAIKTAFIFLSKDKIKFSTLRIVQLQRPSD